MAVLAGGAGWFGSGDPDLDPGVSGGVLAATGLAPVDPGDPAAEGLSLRGAAIVLPQLPAEEPAGPAVDPPAAVIAILELPPPPPPPPAPPPPPVAVWAGSGADAIRAAFAGHPALGWALRVAACESGFNPHAVNGASGAGGLFQFLPSTWRTTPYGNASIFDPMAQAQAARWMYDRGRAGEWVCR